VKQSLKASAEISSQSFGMHVC